MTLAEASQAHPAAAAAPAWDFACVVRLHPSMVYSLALHFLRDPSAAEEVTQEREQSEASAEYQGKPE